MTAAYEIPISVCRPVCIGGVGLPAKVTLGVADSFCIGMGGEKRKRLRWEGVESAFGDGKVPVIGVWKTPRTPAPGGQATLPSQRV